MQDAAESTALLFVFKMNVIVSAQVASAGSKRAKEKGTMRLQKFQEKKRI